MPIGIGAGLAISAGIPGGGAVATGVMQSRAAGGAQRSQQQTVSEQIAFQKEQDRLDREERKRFEEEDRKRWDAEQAQAAEDRALEAGRYTSEHDTSEKHYQEGRATDLQHWMDTLMRQDRSFDEDVSRYQSRETRLQPYRQAGTAAVNHLSQIASQAGITLRPVSQSMTAGLPGAPGAPPVVAPPPPPVPMSNLVPVR
jgi:hypothetical protein